MKRFAHRMNAKKNKDLFIILLCLLAVVTAIFFVLT
jgi:hypothetical protein